MKPYAVAAAFALASLGAASIITSTPVFPPTEGRELNKLLGGLSHGTERFSDVQISNFSNGQLLTKGWDGTIKGVAEIETLSNGQVIDQGTLSYSFDLKYQGLTKKGDLWTISVAQMIAELPGEPQVLFTTKFRQDFGQVKADRHSDVISPAVDSYEISASFNADEFISTDGGATYNPTGADYHFELQTVPEPASMTVLGLGVALISRRRKPRA